MTDMFDRMPYMLVAVSPEMAERIVEAQDRGEDVDFQIPILHLCTYPAPPTDNDMRIMHEELQSDPDLGMQETPYQIMVPPDEGRLELIEWLRSQGVHDESGTDDIAVIEYPGRSVH
jgi:hypothetical protein